MLVARTVAPLLDQTVLPSSRNVESSCGRKRRECLR